MTWDEIKNSDWFEKFVITVLAVALVRVFLPIISIVLIAGVGLILVLLFVDAAMGGTGFQQIAVQIANWLQGLL